MKVLYFAYLVDKLGRASGELTLPYGVNTAGGVLEFLRGRGGVWTQALSEDKVQVVVNRSFVTLETPVTEKDELAIVSKGVG